MSTSQDAATASLDRSFFGHPAGLSTLFFTEMWERFSYYGMRAILLLYMTKTFAEGGLGLAAKYAGLIIIASGHYSMAINTKLTFYAGLILIACGTGLLKPNISAMVGQLYSEEDKRRDAGFSVFYTGINLCAFLSPLVVGYLAQSASFRNLITSWGFDPNSTWHWGFGAAGVGMTIGIIQYVLGGRRLAGVGKS